MVKFETQSSPTTDEKKKFPGYGVGKRTSSEFLMHSN